MKTTCCRTVAVVGIVGAIGSLAGWYWEPLFGALDTHIDNTHFGVILLWLILASVITRGLNHLLYKE